MLQTYVDDFFNQTKNHLPDASVLGTKPGKEASETASSQIALRAGVCRLYGRLFLINACISYIPTEACTEVHHLILCLSTVLDFAVEIISTARTSGHLNKGTIDNTGKWLPTSKTISNIVASIQNTLSRRFQRVYLSVSILGSSAKQLDPSDTVYDILNQICVLLCT